MLAQAVAAIAGAVAGAVVGGSAGNTALGYAAGVLVGAAVNAIIALGGIGLRPRAYPWGTLASWLWLAAAAAAGHVLGGFVRHPALQVALAAMSYCALTLVGLRLLGDGALTLALRSLRRANAQRTFSARLALRIKSLLDARAQ
jgi:hypothetical protein